MHRDPHGSTTAPATAELESMEPRHGRCAATQHTEEAAMASENHVVSAQLALAGRGVCAAAAMALLTLLTLPTLHGCEGALDPSGPSAIEAHATPPGKGPKVVWDPTHKPLPELPLPNNAATRLDPKSPTGRYLNISPDAALTGYERRTRRMFNQLDGFGAYGAISVRFDALLDLADIRTRHANDDFRDDALYLLNVDSRCSRYGEEVALDLGRGRFPITLFGHSKRIPDADAPDGYRLDEEDNRIFPYDPEGESNTMLFNEWNEDANGNGKLDAGEDRDEDGVLDVANFVDPKACDAFAIGSRDRDRCVAANLMTWYERETNTLIARPVWPLQERCTYAVVLTSRLRGADGEPVRSPFATVLPRDQRAALLPLFGFLDRYGLKASDVAFAWSYTVGTMTKDLLALRAGLYGHGPFARLHGQFPVSSWRTLTAADLSAEDGQDNPDPERRLLPPGCSGVAMSEVSALNEGNPQICAMFADNASVESIFAGDFEAPNLLVDKDGMATPQYPADEDEAFSLNYNTGELVVGSHRVPFFCALPRPRKDVTCSPGNPEGKPFCRPYPVVFYAHGYGSFKGETILHAGRHTQMGMAACGIDSFGHGRSVVFDPDCQGHLEYLLGRAKLKSLGVPELLTMVFRGRDRDLNNDGCGDGGADQWTANLFHTRDVVRQSVLDFIQFVRILRAADGKALDSRGGLLGDIDGDGTIDIGGAFSTITAWGISLGGQLTAVLAGAEPSLDAVAPNAVGAGLTDISARLGQGGLAEEVVAPVAGPYVVGCLPRDGHQQPLQAGTVEASCLHANAKQPGLPDSFAFDDFVVGWYGHDRAKLEVRAVGRIGGVRPGDRVVVRNVDKAISRSAHVSKRGTFRLAIPADALWPIARRKLLGFVDGDHAPRKWAKTEELGDRVEVIVYAGDSDKERGRIDRFAWDVTFQGTTYPAQAPLVALQEGLAYGRNTPDFRRFLSIAQHGISSADPAVWSQHYFLDPTTAPYDPAWRPGRMHVLLMPTVGDNNVPAATGVALGRTAGLFGSWLRDPSLPAEHGWRALFQPDPRYGVSIERWLIDRGVVEGDDRFERYHGFAKTTPGVLYDPDNVSDGKARFTCGPSDWSAAIGENGCTAEWAGKEELFAVPTPPAGQELRIARKRADGSHDAFRIPLIRPVGQHGIYNPQPFRAFDADAYMQNWNSRFMLTRGVAVDHLAGCDCSGVRAPTFTVKGKAALPGVSAAACEPGWFKTCSPACAAGFGLSDVADVVCK